jgi:hypothetical protein
MAIIKLKRSETASSVPTTSNLTAGEMAVNIIDKKIYVRDSSNNIIEVANYVAGAGGSYTDTDLDNHLNKNTASPNQVLTWNGTDYTWTTLKDNQKVFTAATSITAGELVFLKEDGEVTNTSTGSPFSIIDNPNAFNTSANDSFGRSVSISESYAIVGAIGEDDAGVGGGTGSDSGKAYIYDTATRNLLYTLDNPNAYDTTQDDWFGSSVGISESYAIVGAPSEDDAGGTSSGKAYIYDTTTGNLLYTLDNPNAYDTSNGDNFGIKVAISESYAIVSAFQEDDAGVGGGTGSASGKAYIYDLSTLTPGTVTSATYVLDNPNAYNTSSGDWFGLAVAISESHAIVGAFAEDDASASTNGKAYLYDLSTLTPGTVTSATYVLDNPNPNVSIYGDEFGYSVGISESYAIVGAWREDDAGGTSSGKAYIYDTTTGNLIYTLDNPSAYDTSAGDNFGISVAISESYAIVGANGEDDAGGTSSGKAYIYSTSTGNLLHILDNPNAYDTSANDNFGFAVSISESYAIVGASGEDDAGGTSSGKAYMLNLPVSTNFTWIGIAAENIAANYNGLVDVAGAINSNQTGLAIGNLYYRDANNQLTTNSSSEGLVGKALSSTELQIFEIDYYNHLILAKSNAYANLTLFS